jgi:hypothetical protein
MLPALRNVPQSDTDWKTWAWDHRTSHDRIRQKIQAVKGIVLLDYQVEPMSPNTLDLFLYNNSQMHDDMNTTLNLTSVDLTDVDFKDPKQVEAWITLHYQEHYNAEAVLGA